MANNRRSKFLVIPDTQVRPGVNTNHLEALGNYIAEKRPDTIIHLGDHFDLPSLSSYALEGEREGRRYQDDIDAARTAMERLCAPMRKAYAYRPRMHFLTGNHENRVLRTVDENPKLIGTMSPDDFDLERFGWRVHPFLKVVKLGGIEFSHYFVSGAMGRPVSSAAALLRERQCSAVMGHRQDFQYAVHPRTQAQAIFAGICYTHQETYLTPQGNASKPQVIMLHEVCNGRFDPMVVSVDYLLRSYW